MEKTIYELEQELKEAKLKKQWDDLQVDLKKAKDKYLGKAWGSHSLRYDSFDKYKSHTYITAIYVENVYLGEDTSYNVSKTTTFDDFKRSPERYKIILRGISLTLYKTDESVNISTGNFRELLHSPYKSDLTHQIDINVFTKIKQLVQNSVDLIYTASIKELPIYECPDWKMDEVKSLEKQGCEFIKLNESERYTINRHPFLYGYYLLKNDISKNIIEELKKVAEENNRRDTGYYCCGEWVKPSGIYAREIETYNQILKKF